MDMDMDTCRTQTAHEQDTGWTWAGRGLDMDRTWAEDAGKVKVVQRALTNGHREAGAGALWQVLART